MFYQKISYLNTKIWSKTQNMTYKTTPIHIKNSPKPTLKKFWSLFRIAIVNGPSSCATTVDAIRMAERIKQIDEQRIQSKQKEHSRKQIDWFEQKYSCLKDNAKKQELLSWFNFLRFW